MDFFDSVLVVFFIVYVLSSRAKFNLFVVIVVYLAALRWGPRYTSRLLQTGSGDMDGESATYLF